MQLMQEVSQGAWVLQINLAQLWKHCRFYVDGLETWAVVRNWQQLNILLICCKPTSLHVEFLSSHDGRF